MDTIAATNARSNFFQILKKILKSHLPTRISSKEGNVIVVPEEDYESLLETAELLSIPGFKESIERSNQEIANNDLYSLDEVFSD